MPAIFTRRSSVRSRVMVLRQRLSFLSRSAGATGVVILSTIHHAIVSRFTITQC